MDSSAAKHIGGAILLFVAMTAIVAAALGFGAGFAAAILLFS